MNDRYSILSHFVSSRTCAVLLVLLGLTPVLGAQSASAQFPQKVIVASSSNAPTAVDSADIDGDGDKDILVASDADDQIAWYENQIGESGADSDGFAAPKTITTNASEAKSVSTADIDGDGDQDVLSASSLDGKIAWYENQVGESGADSDGFGEQKIIANPGESVSVVAADLDGDGDQDVLSAAMDQTNIAWYENKVGESGADEDGFGDPKIITDNAGGARSIRTADIDGDGDQDALFAIGFEGKIVWHPNQIGEAGADSTGFGAQQTIATNVDGLSSVTAADLDGDDDPDVLSASTGGFSSGGKVAWYENQIGESGADSTGFGTQQTITTNVSRATSVAAANLDGDSDPDILSASEQDDKVAWYENQIGESGADSDGFGAQQTITTNAKNAQSVAAADLDGDGDREAFAAAKRTDKVAWYENKVGETGADSDGFGPEQVITTTASWAWSVAAADLDGDGDRDVLSASNRDDRVAWYENQVGEAGADADGFGRQQTITLNAEGALSVTTADLDGDGDQDVLSASTLDETLSWYENQIGEAGADSDGFGPEQTIATFVNDASSVTAADFDGDGDLDVLANGVEWYENQIGESGADADGFGSGKTIRSGAGSVTAADLDGDGDPDVLAGGSELAWYENQVGESGADSDGFGPKQTITTSVDAVESVATADLDGDGDADALSASRGDTKVAWYENQVGESGADSDGFGAQQTMNANAGGYSVTAADLDGDGDEDVLSTSADFDVDIVWYENRIGESGADSTGFGAKSTITERAGGIQSIAAADLDRDGDEDVLSASRSDDKIAWYVNDVSSVLASQSAAVGSSGEVDFGPTGTDIDFSGVSGSGSVTVSKFGRGPANTDGIAESNVSAYRFTIEADTGLTVGSSTQIQLDVSTLRGLDNVTTSGGEASNVTIYKRSTEGSGSFTALTTTYDASSNEVRASTGSFSEFVLASDSARLPVELARFDAKAGDGSARLTWATASETNNAGFRVQHRGPNAETWRALGFVDSKADGGTTTEAHSYRFAAEHLSVGTHEFRLEQVDLDGTAHRSKTVTIELGLDQPVRLTAPAPNPVRGRATLSFAVQEARRTTVRLYDALGRQVTTLYRGTPTAGESQTVALPAADLSSGVYFVRLRAGERTATRRLTVVR